MNDRIVKYKPNPKLGASFLSKLLFGWIIKLCYENDKKNFTLYECLPSYKSKEVCNKLEINWKKELMNAKRKNTKPLFYKSIFKTFFRTFLINGIFQFLSYCVLRIIQPILFSHFISLFSENSDYQKLDGYYYEKLIYGGSISILSILTALLNHHSLQNLNSLGLKINVACSSLIYKKMLRLNEKSITKTSGGQILNLLSNDVQSFTIACRFFNYFWIIPIQIILISYLTWLYAELGAIIGILVIFTVTIPVHTISTKFLRKIKEKVDKETDIRISKICEIISNIRLIKMYDWEKLFLLLINKSRIQELKIKNWTFYIRGLSIASTLFIDKFALFITLIIFSLTGNVITTQIVYYLAQYFSDLRTSMAVFYSTAIESLAHCIVCVERIENFLLLDEIIEDQVQKSVDKEIIFEDVEVSWKSENPTLSNVNLDIPKGSLCILVGPVGSGKTSLLQLVINTLSPSKGNVKLGGTVSYFVQNSWIFDSTIRNNILFGEKYEQELYDSVIKVCELEKDLKIFSNGDNTIVGENGIQLSGGQKARITLARTIYKDCDIYLLDDPLSAVDVNVVDKLFNGCIVNFLKNKTRVLVTNQLQFLKNADYIISIQNRQVLIEDHQQHINNSRLPSLFFQENKENLEISKDLKRDATKVDDKYISGNPFTVFWKFAQFGGNCFAYFGLLLLLILTQVLVSSLDVLTLYWSYKESVNASKCAEEKFDEASTNFMSCDQLLSTDTIIIIYAALIIFTLFVLTGRTIYFQQLLLNVLRNVHQNMIKSVLSTYLLFFDNHSSGEIMHRFTNDIWTIDEIIPSALLYSAQIIFLTIGILCSVVILNYYMIAPIIILSVIFYVVLAWYILITNEIKHEESTSKSSLLAHTSASFTGLSTVRAMGKEDILITEFHQHQDINTSVQYLSTSFSSGVCFYMEFLTALLQGSLILAFIIISQFAEHVLAESVVGFLISQSLLLSGMLQFGANQLVVLCKTLTSVERILEYTNLEFETKENQVKGVYSLTSWSKEGNINFENVSMKYSQTGSYVLKNISFNIASREKVGVIGRTGAGKSSLIYALLRLSPLEGNIMIDGVSTKEIKLNELRRNISIIPQDPILFSGTLRYNLDPSNKYSDKELWEALEKVELKSVVDSLSYTVKEGGTGFSVGEKQLICLARAILRRNKILVLDEATANVDLNTDELIQTTIRSILSDCTVIIIAHRLHTIMDADRVIVMDAGKIVENDKPHKLLQNCNGVFHEMVEKTGLSKSLELRSIAEKHK